jgi:Flp pilus assembly protein TadG
MAVLLTGLLLFTGLAVDGGRGYLVKAQLTKAVDGAALGAARNLNGGDPKGEATRIFKANFPAGFMGTSAATDPTADPGFFTLVTDTVNAVNVVTVTASEVMPTSFMQLGNIYQVTVTSSGQATRRMVDLSLVLDVSSSIGSKWPIVRDAARTFVNSFDELHDRLSLLTFSNGAVVLDQMPSLRGFNKPVMVNDVPQNLPGGSTLMVEGLYRGWDELRTVPTGTQSSLRVIVLFTDGASNGVPGIYPQYSNVTPVSLRTYDFPHNAIDPDNQTWDQPQINGFFDPQGNTQYSAFGVPEPWNNHVNLANAPCLPNKTLHIHYRSVGIPTAFDLQSGALKVNGMAQNAARPMRDQYGVGAAIPCPVGSPWPAEVWNVNNAARNVLEIIADAARNDAGGDYKVRIYSIGMSYLVRDLLGTMPEMPEDILKRVSNDKTSPDFNVNQLEGKYFYAATAADVGPAFQGIQNEILRLSK